MLHQDATAILDSHPTTYINLETGEARTFTPVTPVAELYDLINNDGPVITTNMVWVEMTIPDRLRFCRDIGKPAAFAKSETVFPVLSEEAKEWIKSCQFYIDRGDVWRGPGTVGRFADNLIDEGYCLLGPSITDGYFSKVPGREERRAGTAGTRPFVRGMMGQDYLDWLLTVSPNAPAEPAKSGSAT